MGSRMAAGTADMMVALMDVQTAVWWVVYWVCCWVVSMADWKDTL